MDSQSHVHIPDAVSRQALNFLRTERHPALIPAFPTASFHFNEAAK
jgi:hypothetical protein